MTKLQKAIYNIVMNSGEHLSAEQVYWKVKQQIPSVALGTVYRNLNRFADDRLIRRVGRSDAADLFEGNCTPHDHAVCARCGQMTDLVVPGLKVFLEAQISGDIISYDLTLNYICARCRDTKEE